MLSPTTNDVSVMGHCFQDFPSGPLDTYRHKASFDWKKMKLLREGDEVIEFKQKIWNLLKNDPIFKRKPWEELSREEERKITFKRLKKLAEYQIATRDDYLSNPYLIPAFVQALGQFSWSLMIKRLLSTEYFLVTLSTEYNGPDKEQLEKAVLDLIVLGAISMTEMAHGSNTKELKTLATYDPNTQEFILSTPSLEATKVWSGVLGESATHAIVYAQLYTADGKCHGLHSFMVPIRDPKTQLLYPGVIVGDMGAKIGLNGLDNGFMTFKNYRIPKSSLMGKSSKLTDSGEYIAHIKDESKRFGATLGVLSTGRIFITMISLTNMETALSIAVRYSAVRKQFGPDNKEWPIIEYQSQQWRLIPYIAASYVIHNLFGSLYRDYVDFFVSIILSPEKQASIGAEIHCISSCAKAVVSWLARDAIQECRECCGGHGYLKASRIGEIRNDHDANNTYEGDNNILLQQTSNYLMKFYKEKLEDKPVNSYFGTITFINDYESILKSINNGHLLTIDDIIFAYRFLVCLLMKESDTKLSEEMKKMNDSFIAKARCQVYYLRSLAICYFEYEAISKFLQFIKEQHLLENNIKLVLEKLGLLYGLWSIDKHLTTLIEFNYFQQNIKPATFVRSNILKLCEQLKNDAVSLTDCLAPPDFILNSCIGQSDGHIYENIFDSLINNKGAFVGPEWTKEIIEDRLQSFMTINTKVKSKL